MVFWWSKGKIIIIFFKKIYYIILRVYGVWIWDLQEYDISIGCRSNLNTFISYPNVIQVDGTYIYKNQHVIRKQGKIFAVGHTHEQSRTHGIFQETMTLFWTSCSRRWHTNIIVIRFGALIPRGPTADADDIDAEWFYIVWLTSSWPSFVSFGDIMEDCVVMGFIRSDQGRETGPKAKIERVAGGTSTDPC